MLCEKRVLCYATETDSWLIYALIVLINLYFFMKRRYFGEVNDGTGFTSSIFCAGCVCAKSTVLPKFTNQDTTVPLIPNILFMCFSNIQ